MSRIRTAVSILPNIPNNQQYLPLPLLIRRVTIVYNLTLTIDFQFENERSSQNRDIKKINAAYKKVKHVLHRPNKFRCNLKILVSGFCS